MTHINTSYLTVNEYKRAPSAVNTSNLDYFAGLTDTSAQDAELANVIARASAWIDNYCQLPDGLAASVNTETRAVYLTRTGFLRIHPNNFPVLNLQSLQWRMYPNAAWTTVDINNIQVYDRHFETLMWFPFLSGPALTVGSSYAYPVSVPYMPYVDPTTRANLEELQIAVQYTYTNGYPNTTLSADAVVGATTITVDDATGVQPGTILTMYDGGNTERVTVASVAGAVITLTKPLIFAHSAGLAVSSIPADVKAACILIVNYLLKERGVNSITMEGVQNPQMQKYDDTADLDVAKSMLRKYRRVV